MEEEKKDPFEFNPNANTSIIINADVGYVDGRKELLDFLADLNDLRPNYIVTVNVNMVFE